MSVAGSSGLHCITPGKEEKAAPFEFHLRIKLRWTRKRSFACHGVARRADPPSHKATAGQGARDSTRAGASPP